MYSVRWILIFALLGLPACARKPPKNAVTLGMHLTASPVLPADRRTQVVLRTPALTLQIDPRPVLTERDLDKVELTREGDNFAMRLVFNTHGTIELDRVSLDRRNDLIVVLINGIAVAAPQLKKRIVDGVFEFTPDLTRKEAEKVVEGLKALVEYENPK